MIWAKPSGINYGRFGPNRPESEFLTKLSIKKKPSTSPPPLKKIKIKIKI
jgi:hypothetical protein